MPSRPPVTIRLRRARRGDLDALLALEEQTFDSDRISRRQWRRHLGGPSCAIQVAERERQLLGAALVFFRRGSRLARLYSIAIAGSARGLGLGRRLLIAAEALARRRGARAMRLEVRQDNPAAIGLYQSHGYQRIGQRLAYYEDGAPAWRYEKRFTSAPVRR